MPAESINQDDKQHETGESSPAVLYLAFANHSDAPLPNLVVESREVHKILHPREVKGHFKLHREDFAELDSIAHYLPVFRNQVQIFHYGGHAGSASLLLYDLEANAAGIVTMLAQQKDLALVFLNGCSTKKQVGSLLNKGIPAVIATSAPVDDTRAKDFAIRFYHALSFGHSIGDSFEMAKGYIEAQPKSSITFNRGIFEPDTTTVDTSHWGLFTRNEKALEWALPGIAKSMRQETARLTGDMAMVNCNRKEILKRFDLGFDLAEDLGQPVVSFLLLHQPYGESQSLIKRLITHLDKNREGVKYPGFDKIDIETVDLDFTESRSEAERLVRNAFNRQVGGNKLGSLNAFVKAMEGGEFPSFKHVKYIPLTFIFKFHTTAWQNVFNPLLEWIFTDFLRLEAEIARDRMFVCFFVLEPLRQDKAKATNSSSFWGKLLGQPKVSTNPDEELYLQMKESLHRCITQTPVFALPKLTKVHREDLDDWYRDYESNEAQREVLVDKLIEKILEELSRNAPKRFSKNMDCWDMSDVEIQLKNIVEAHRNKERGI